MRDNGALPVAEGIHLSGVSKGFGRRGQRVEALRGIDLEVAEGELVSLIGPSGCGKTTLLRVIGGLLEADAGVVRVGTLPPDEARRRKHFGFVPQVPALLPWRDVLGNVELLGEVNRRHGTAPRLDARTLLAQVGLTGFEHAHPRELSGGMQQRVALARAMALCAPVLLMDEPLAALDEITRADMRHLVLDVWERSGATCVFVTHSIEEAVLLSDRVVVMAPRPGHITAIEPIDLPRPRPRGVEDEPRFHEHVRRIRQALGAGKR
ncbi:ABC transporter ATP-binding protein [Actinomarinicola tropica]|uniref:ATP-binding cassette domain-containing protein n=1 Tax=Actinomarinicola tropica TaxID=2789776 RepID=A0A5Q2RLE4_9ACTN|nr:ABC transporter ATP-binding protein [Actinomarinicola tropica]QGG94887.1 ATP-binding cassette domain-containing protein [Actinomarinicola tropica]